MANVAAKRPAHRPSRRDAIVDAAIAVFSARGYTDTSVSDVAEAAGLTPTAVYYHFAQKDDLYTAAIAKVLGAVDEVVARVRADDDVDVEPTRLHDVIDAVWEWVDENPGPATLMHLHTPAATKEAAQLRREFDERHVMRAFVYTSDGGRGEPNATRKSEATIAVRTLVDVLIAIHPMRLPGGPLSDCSPTALRRAVKDLSTRLVLTV